VIVHPGTLGSAMVFAVLPALALLALIYWLDRYEKEPGRLLGIALLFGAVAAPLVAFLVEKAAGVPTSLAVQTVVSRSRLSPWTPLIQELATGAAVLGAVLVVRYEIDDLLDGFVYGSVVGVGFGLAANFMAILTTHAIGGGGSVSLTTTMLGGLNFVLYGAVIGVIVGAARRAGTGALLGAALAGSAVAYGLQIVHDYLPWWVSAGAGNASGSAAAGAIAEIPTYLGIAALAVLVPWTQQREGRIVGRQLHDEVGRSVTAEEYDIVTNPLKRWAVMFRALYTGGNDFGLRRRLYSQAVELAFRKHHRATDRTAGGGLVEEDVYRRRLAETRAQLNLVLEEAARRRTPTGSR
jgi:RsiW-degrading membrane proteinase PrsW (M82 family)